MEAEDVLILGLVGAVVVMMAKNSQSQTTSGQVLSYSPFGPISLPAEQQCPSGMMYQAPPTVASTSWNSQYCVPAPTTPQAGTQYAGCPANQLMGGTSWGQATCVPTTCPTGQAPGWTFGGGQLACMPIGAIS